MPGVQWVQSAGPTQRQHQYALNCFDTLGSPWQTLWLFISLLQASDSVPEGGADFGPVAPGPSAPDGGGAAPASDDALGADSEVRRLGGTVCDELLPALLIIHRLLARLSKTRQLK